MSTSRSGMARKLGSAAAANVGAAAILIARNLLDSYFAASVSLEALAVLTVTVPVTLLLIGLSQGISVVAGHAVAMRRKSESADTGTLIARIHLLAAACGLVVAIVLELACSAAVPRYVADPVLAGRATVLLHALLASGPLLFLYSAATSVLRAHDMAAVAARVVTIGLGAGIALTAALMLGPGKGWLPGEPLLGIAAGLALGYGLTSLLALHALRGAGLLAAPGTWQNASREMSALLRKAAPAMMTNTIALGAMFFVTAAMAAGGPAAMAAFGAAFRIEQFGMILLNSMVLAIVPPAAGHMRKGDREALYLVVSTGLMLITALGLVIGVLLVLSTPWILASLHLADSAAALLAFWLRFVAVALLFQGITQTIVGLVQVKQGRLALIITVARLYGFMLPLLWWLGGTKPHLLYLAMSATHVAGGCLLLACAWYRHRYPKVAPAIPVST